MVSIDFVLAFEGGTATAKEIIDGFAELIKSGAAWTLQGFYGRTAMGLIEAGYISREGEVLGYPEEEAQDVR